MCVCISIPFLLQAEDNNFSQSYSYCQVNFKNSEYNGNVKYLQLNFKGQIALKYLPEGPSYVLFHPQNEKGKKY